MIKQNQRGFSLLEILVAFVVLALTLSMIMQIFSGGLRNVGRSDEYSRAVLVAEAKLAEISGSPLQLGTQSGVADNFKWSSNVTVYADPVASAQNPLDPNLAVELYKIDVDVSWGEEEKPRTLRLNTVRLVPKK